MKIKNYKGYIIGTVIGASLMFSAQSFAKVGDKIEAVFAEFNIKVNGDVKKLDTSPIVYNGSSYLPVRDVANLVGFDVTYKADSRTIELNTSNESEVVINKNLIESDETKLANEGWISLTNLNKVYQFNISVGEKTSIKSDTTMITFNTPFADNDKEIYVETNLGDLKLKIQNGAFYLKTSELIKVGLLD